jgi:hypothetical protein
LVKIGKIFGKMGIITHRHSRLTRCNIHLKRIFTRKKMWRPFNQINRPQISWHPRIKQIRTSNRRYRRDFNVIIIVAQKLSRIPLLLNDISCHIL